MKARQCFGTEKREDYPKRSGSDRSAFLKLSRDLDARPIVIDESAGEGGERRHRYQAKTSHQGLENLGGHMIEIEHVGQARGTPCPRKSMSMAE